MLGDACLAQSGARVFSLLRFTGKSPIRQVVQAYEEGHFPQQSEWHATSFKPPANMSICHPHFINHPIVFFPFFFFTVAVLSSKYELQRECGSEGRVDNGKLLPCDPVSEQSQGLTSETILRKDREEEWRT